MSQTLIAIVSHSCKHNGGYIIKDITSEWVSVVDNLYCSTHAWHGITNMSTSCMAWHY